MTREEAKELLLSQCKILNTYSWSDDRKAYDVPKYVLSDSKTLKLINKIYDEHEAEMKQAYIDGSNSCNELIQSLYKQIEQLKDKQ